jgi:peptidoglycan/LPS O-acetylase OafA/YrhL
VASDTELTPRRAHTRFRPDVEGLRAVAVGAVVLFHSHVGFVSGGFTGVDVFYVISGFLITGLLLAEQLRSGRLSIPGFYARRCRRILPAATLVLIATTLASYHWLGFIRGATVAEDVRAAALFFANQHFAAIGVDYLGSQRAPSPVQHYWSLSVEEQFYLAWPLLLVCAVAVLPRVSLRLRLGVLAGVITLASMAWSIHLTAANGTAAFFSPFSRAWELSVGALIAISGPALARLSPAARTWMSLTGIATIAIGACTLTTGTPFPGLAAAVPVGGAALVLAAGCDRGHGATRVLGTTPFQWVGKLSYAWYLWHWPLLIIVEQQRGSALSPPAALLLSAGALALAFVTYYIVEQPVRTGRIMSGRRPALVMGVVLIGLAVVLATLEIESHPHVQKLPATQNGPVV